MAVGKLNIPERNVSSKWVFGSLTVMLAGKETCQSPEDATMPDNFRLMFLRALFRYDDRAGWKDSAGLQILACSERFL